MTVSQSLNRRGALTVLSAGLSWGLAASAAGPALARTARRAAHHAAMPWLYSPDQLQSELMLLQLEREPAVLAIQANIRKDLLASPRGRIPDAAKTLDRALAEWTRSLIVAECNHRPSRPFFIWGTDDTPREWLGHKLGGVGTSGDNPDAIYRTAGLEGGGRYEITGRFDKGSRPVQLLMEVDAGDMAQPAKIMPVSGGKHEDIHSSAMLSDRELAVAPDGSFRITLGGQADGPNHLAIPASGYVMCGVRDMLGNWTDRPSKLAIRRLDNVAPEPWSLATVRRRVLDDLEGYIRFWAHFPDIWFGGIKPNTKSDLQARPGGWGFVAGLNFHLAPDEAMLVTFTSGGALYTGFQINDPWMIAPDARARQVCLNKNQTVPSPDGSATYVIAKSDPLVANWLDTDGMNDGLAIMRWQAIPPGLKGDGLIRDFRVIKLADIARMPDLPRVTPGQRRAQVAARWAAYSARSR